MQKILLIVKLKIIPSSGSESSLFFIDYFSNSELKSGKDAFQQDFARMTDDVDVSIVLAEMQVTILGSVLIRY